MRPPDENPKESERERNGMKDKFQTLKDCLLKNEHIDILSLLQAYAEGLREAFGSDARGGLVRFAEEYEYSFGECGVLLSSIAAECPLTGGAFDRISVDGDEVLRLKIGKRDSLVVILCGNRFLPMRARFTLSKNRVAAYTDWMYWSIVGHGGTENVPRNWKESLSAGLNELRKDGSVLFFGPAEHREFPGIWSFEQRMDEWIGRNVIPVIRGSRKMYLTSGIFAVLCPCACGKARELINESYRNSSLRDGKLDFVAAALPVPPYFKESIEPFLAICSDAKRLLDDCNGDDIAVVLSRREEEKV